MSYEAPATTITAVREQLRLLRGGQAKVWLFRFSYSQIALRITLPEWTSRRAYLDCTACSRMSFVPAWEPVNIDVEVRPNLPHSPLLVIDGENFRVECQSVQIEQLDDDNLRMFPPNSGHQSSAELIDRISKGPYLPERSLSALTAFISGYEHALHNLRAKWKDEHLSLYEFEDWLKVRLCGSRTLAPLHVVLREAYADDGEAYHRFFELWAEYRAQKNSEAIQQGSDAEPESDRPLGGT